MLLVIGIVGTTVAPWQLFFQQSYVIDKRITPRFMKYEGRPVDRHRVRADRRGRDDRVQRRAVQRHPEAGNFTDAGGIIAGLEKYAGRTSATLFAVALLDACIIGAAAVSLSTAYAIGDVFKIRHSLHRGVSDAKGFYLVYFGIVAAAATLVLIPGSPLGLLTEAVQTLAGVLLPSATVFLLVLCNDRQVLGPWVNSTKLNVFTGAVIWVLVLLSIILTASVMYPDISGEAIVDVLVGGTVLAITGYIATVLIRRNKRVVEPAVDRSLRDTWRMPPLDTLEPQNMTVVTRIWMAVLRGYLVIAVGLVIVRWCR